MLGPRTLRLLQVASPALGDAARPLLGSEGEVSGLADLLESRNGFYAFESALHVLPAGRSTARTVESWNASEGWRSGYAGMADGLLFFAEDVFGGQFALKGGRVLRFDPETGDIGDYASSIEDWVDQLLDDYQVLTGYPLAHDWQVSHGPLLPGTRLLPKVPFVLGGDYTLDNLYSLDAEEGMRLRGELAVQLRDLPEGSVVRYRAGE